MSNLVVILFEGAEDAGDAFEALEEIQNTGNLEIEDSAVIVKDSSGKVDVQNTMASGTKTGIVGGGLIGLLLGGIFFPLAGLALGAAAGGLISKAADLNVDQKFINDVTEQLEPDSSALFVIVGRGNPAAAIAALRQFKGKVLQTSLPFEVVESLKAALDDK